MAEGRQVALDLVRQKFSVIPIRAGTKAPAVRSWKPFQQARMNETEIRQSFVAGDQIGIVCGKVSRHLEVIDFDTQQQGRAEHFTQWIDLLEANGFRDLVVRLVVAQTPSGGFHVYYRCGDGIEGSQKLAVAATKVKGKDCLIETRGEGAYVVAPPSQGYRWLDDRGLEEIATISADERAVLLSYAKAFHQVAEPERHWREVRNGERPGDWFNAHGDMTDLLRRAGWEYLYTSGENEAWRRPGKDRREPGGTFHSGRRTFYCFSTNAAPLEAGRAYGAFALMAELFHRGDFSEASRAVVGMREAGKDGGMGTPPPRASAPPHVGRSTCAAAAPNFLPHLGGRVGDGGAMAPSIELRSSGCDGLGALPTRRLSEFERGREPRYGVCGKYIISGDVTLLDGAGGLGKSTLLLGIAAAGSVGRDLFGREGIEPFRTLMFTTEDDGDALLDRYDFFRGDPDRLELVDRPLDLSSPATLDSLRATVVNGGFGFVVLDPGLTYMGRRANINDPKEVNDFMLGLRGVARETGAAILVVRHFRKGAKFSELEEKGGGTNQFRDAARSQLVMFRNPKNRAQRVVVHAKGNLRTEEQPPFGFEWDGPRFAWIMPGTLDPSDWEGK